MLNFNLYNEQITGLYEEKNNYIIPKHNYITGERNLCFAFLEMMIGNIEVLKNVNAIEYFLDDLLRLLNDNGLDYLDLVENLLRNLMGLTSQEINEAKDVINKNFSDQRLSKYERQFMLNIIRSLKADFMFKGDFENLDYDAIKVYLHLAYRLLDEQIEQYISDITLYVGMNGILEKYEYVLTEDYNENIMVDWMPQATIDHYYSIYKAKYKGLRDSSILELAYLQTKEDALKNSRDRMPTYRSLTNEYFGIIEQEINEIINLTGLRNSTKHLMWWDMKEFVKDNNIDLVSTGNLLNSANLGIQNSETTELENKAVDNVLYSILENLRVERNDASHGEELEREDFEKILELKNNQFFEFISWTKLELIENKNSRDLEK